MTTLDRYVLREWAKVFFLATFGFPLLVFVIDLADNLEKYMNGGSRKVIWRCRTSVISPRP